MHASEEDAIGPRISRRGSMYNVTNQSEEVLLTWWVIVSWASRDPGLPWAGLLGNQMSRDRLPSAVPALAPILEKTVDSRMRLNRYWIARRKQTNPCVVVWALGLSMSVERLMKMWTTEQKE